MIVIAALVGVVSGMINTLAGGGSMWSLPALMWMGLPADVANGTNRIGLITQAASASWTYERNGEVEWGRVAVLAPLGMFGALLGAMFATYLDPEVFRKVMGVLLLVVAGPMALRPGMGEPKLTFGGGRIEVFLLGVYAGILQAGLGLWLLLVLVRRAGMNLVPANAVKVAIAGLIAVPSLIWFSYTGLVRWELGLAMGAGAAVGGVLAVKISLEGGERYIRYAALMVVAVTAWQLFST